MVGFPSLIRIQHGYGREKETDSCYQYFTRSMIIRANLSRDIILAYLHIHISHSTISFLIPE